MLSLAIPRVYLGEQRSLTSMQKRTREAVKASPAKALEEGRDNSRAKCRHKVLGRFAFRGALNPTTSKAFCDSTTKGLETVVSKPWFEIAG